MNNPFKDRDDRKFLVVVTVVALLLEDALDYHDVIPLLSKALG